MRAFTVPWARTTLQSRFSIEFLWFDFYTYLADVPAGPRLWRENLKQKAHAGCALLSFSWRSD